jgi:hypothetical protein
VFETFNEYILFIKLSKFTVLCLFWNGYRDRYQTVIVTVTVALPKRVKFFFCVTILWTPSNAWSRSPKAYLTYREKA